MGQWEGRHCVQSFGKTKDEAKVLAHQIAGHTQPSEDYEEQLCNTETRIDAVQTWISELEDSVAKATEIRRKQHSEFVTLIADIAAATGLLKLAANRLNKVRAQVAQGCAPLWCRSLRAQHWLAKRALDELRRSRMSPRKQRLTSTWSRDKVFISASISNMGQTTTAASVSHSSAWSRFAEWKRRMAELSVDTGVAVWRVSRNHLHTFAPAQVSVDIFQPQCCVEGRAQRRGLYECPHGRRDHHGVLGGVAGRSIAMLQAGPVAQPSFVCDVARIAWRAEHTSAASSCSLTVCHTHLSLTGNVSCYWLGHKMLTTKGSRHTRWSIWCFSGVPQSLFKILQSLAL